MRKQTIIFFTTFIILSSLIQAHSGDDKKIVIHQSPEIGKLVTKHIEINKNFKRTDGYRVQIFSISGPNSSDRANLMKAEFISKYPEAEVHIVYKAPYYKVRLGDFRNKLNAEKYMKSIKSDYPFAFVVVDKIDFK